jgi:hypothetical protein
VRQTNDTTRYTPVRDARRRPTKWGAVVNDSLHSSPEIFASLHNPPK